MIEATYKNDGYLLLNESNNLTNEKRYNTLGGLVILERQSYRQHVIMEIFVCLNLELQICTQLWL